jgi:hypothetical protein
MARNRSIFTKREHGPSSLTLGVFSPQSWCFSYLCVGEGQRITAAKFSDKLHQWNQDYFDCRWGLRDFRQGAITMGREFIAADDSYDQADSILAESADHSTAIDHSHYAVVHGGIPRLSNNSMCKHRWLGDLWHSLLGLGPFPPPEAIRVKQRNEANGTTFELMSAQLMKTVQTHLDTFFATEFKVTLKDSISAVLREHDEQLGVVSLGSSSSECKHRVIQPTISFYLCRNNVWWGAFTRCKWFHRLWKPVVEFTAGLIYSMYFSM